MKALTCEMCGSTNIIKQNGVFVCQNCGTKYSVEDARQMMNDDNGPVEVTGSVRIDTSNELKNLYTLARRYRDADNTENAAKYYDQILISDPNSWEANFYLVYFSAFQAKKYQVPKIADDIHNIIAPTIQLIKEHVTDEDEQEQALKDVISRTETIAPLLMKNGLDLDPMEFFATRNTVKSIFFQICAETEKHFNKRYSTLEIEMLEFVCNNVYLDIIKEDCQKKLAELKKSDNTDTAQTPQTTETDNSPEQESPEIQKPETPKPEAPKPQIETPKPEPEPVAKKNNMLWLWVALAVAVVLGVWGVFRVVKLVNSQNYSNDNDYDVIEEVAEEVAEDNYNESTEYVANGVAFKMVKVEGGTFTMGATSDDEDPLDYAEPPHSVTLSSYSIGETEVTQALWQAVMGNNPSDFTGDNQRPVETVSWEDCQEFIRKLNSLTGKNFRLPTEAEWEYAARGGNKSKGYKYSGSNSIGDVAWFWQNSGDKFLSGTDDDWDYDKILQNNCKTHPVKQKQANELGIYDMSGNVWEWCQDRYGDYNSSSQTNPTGPSSGSDRKMLGGSWYYDARSCRSSYRANYYPVNGVNFLGLRLALSE